MTIDCLGHALSARLPGTISRSAFRKEEIVVPRTMALDIVNRIWESFLDRRHQEGLKGLTFNARDRRLLRDVADIEIDKIRSSLVHPEHADDISSVSSVVLKMIDDLIGKKK